MPSSIGCMYSLRDSAAYDLVLEAVARVRLAWVDTDLHVACTARGRPSAWGVLHFAVRRTRERFLIGHLRLADQRLDAELAFQAVNDDLKVLLACALDPDLSRLAIDLYSNGRVLRHEQSQALFEPFVVCRRLRSTTRSRTVGG